MARIIIDDLRTGGVLVALYREKLVRTEQHTEAEIETQVRSH